MEVFEFIATLNKNVPTVEQFQQSGYDSNTAKMLREDLCIEPQADTPTETGMDAIEQIYCISQRYNIRGNAYFSFSFSGEPCKIGQFLCFGIACNENLICLHIGDKAIYLIDCYDHNFIYKCADSLERFFDAFIIFANVVFEDVLNVGASSIERSTYAITCANLAAKDPEVVLPFYLDLIG